MEMVNGSYPLFNDVVFVSRSPLCVVGRTLVLIFICCRVALQYHFRYDIGYSRGTPKFIPGHDISLQF